MREKPVCDGVPLIVMPGCPEARCCVKPVKGHRGRGVLWEARDFNTGSQRAGGWMGRGGPRAGGGMSEAAGDRGSDLQGWAQSPEAWAARP